jgi:hypothetical protein
MAQVARDFTNDQSRYTQVLFQRGKVVIDGELNEIGRLVRVDAKRLSLTDTTQANMGEPITDVPTISSGFFVLTKDEDGSLGDNEIKIINNNGLSHDRTLWQFRGYTWEMTEPVSFDLGQYAGGGENQIQQLYVVIKEVEVDSAVDPTIKVNALSETAVRVKLDVTFFLGAVDDTNAVLNADNNSEPWEGGQRAGLIADIVRNGQAPLLRANVHYRFRMAREVYDVSDKFYAQGAIRASIHSRSGGRAYITDDGVTLKLDDIAVLMGFFAQNDNDESISARLNNIDVPMADWNEGDCLVLEMPSHPPGYPMGVGGGTTEEWEVVYNEQPGPGQVRLSVQKFAGWGGKGLIAERNTMNDLQNRFVLAAWLTKQNSSINNGDLEYDIMFADGSRLTFKDDPSNNSADPKEGVSWGYGSDIIRRYSLPDPAAPGVGDPDETGYAIGRARPESPFKLLFAQKVRDDFTSTMWIRWYAMSSIDLDLPASAQTSGRNSYGMAVTVNAQWQQVGDAGSWSRDVSNRGSSIWYQGATVNTTGNGDGRADSYYAQAFRDADQGASSWGEDEWITQDPNVEAGAHTYWDDKGNIGTIAANSPRIYNYGSLNLSGNLDPTVGNPLETGTLYQRSIAKAAVTLKSFGNGSVIIESDSLNISSINTVPTGAGPGYIEVNLATQMSGVHRPLSATMDYTPVSTDVADRLDLVTANHNSNGVVRIYIYDHQNANWEPWNAKEFWVSVVIFGSN